MYMTSLWLIFAYYIWSDSGSSIQIHVSVLTTVGQKHIFAVMKQSC